MCFGTKVQTKKEKNSKSEVNRPKLHDRKGERNETDNKVAEICYSHGEYNKTELE